MLQKIFIICCFLLVASCAGKVNRIDKSGVMAGSVAQKGDFPFIMEPLPVALMKAFTEALPDRILAQYDNYLQPVLEKEFDGKKIKFHSRDKSLKVDFHLRESFKIVQQNIYCREYAQHVEFMGDMINNIGVACKGKRKIWKNLVLLTQ